ncbi:MAG: ROK family protein [Victivallales bacterium]|nr:ROK family protein [Victivallales bacterium]
MLVPAKALDDCMAENSSVRQVVYDAIAESKSISRIRLAKQYKLRLATVTEVTRSLIEDGFIEEAGEEKSTGGRKPVLLRINRDAFYTIGFKLSRSHLACGVFSAGMTQKFMFSRTAPQDMDGAKFLEILSDMTRAAIAETGIKRDKFKGIGIGLPAGVDIVKGIYHGAAYYPNLKNVPLKEVLEAEFKMPVLVDHDVVLMTLAEYYLSGAGIPDNLGVLFVGWGIGCRFILNGEIYRGVHNKASEFGHLSLEPDGPECYCGNRGCLERFASTEAIEQQYGGTHRFSEIVEFAADGDAKALKLLNDAAEYLARAIAVIINLMDVEMLIINGDIVIAENLISEAFYNALDRYTFTTRSDRACNVAFSRIGVKVGILGPALRAADNYYSGKGINIFVKRR